MNGHQYTQEQIDFLFKHGGQTTRRELTKLFNDRFGTDCTVSGIRTVCKRRKVPCIERNFYSEVELEWLKENSGLMSREELAKAYNERFGEESRSKAAIKSITKKHKWFAPTDGRFKKGHNITWTKGRSAEEIKEHMGEEKYNKMIENLLRIKYQKGDVYQRKIGNEHVPYVIVSTERNIPIAKRCVPQTRYVWEKHNGKLPDGYMIIHLDGDNKNNSIENLEAVSYSENGYLLSNHWHGKGEITKTGIAYAKLMNAIKEVKGE
jgi:hypothetical protein